ncbi:PREDICTED: ERI1 exoribonuclease 3 [Dufourea novaeangliae]|uniref:ERI1 exoribonuclease 3 n=1 Tax=Dufourea novaeangliae TaxID=178035 RepID=UPI000767A310|nr:PREDICTED: ERI1 exoribonuclease 3 [Dufourea novaeangliae]
MANQFLKRYPRIINKGSKEVKQHFNYLLVLDLEATCKEFEKLQPQEIIEFPCVALSTKNWKVENVFHQYIKPKVHPQLTPFCTKLTGIIQEMVENQPHFPEVFDKFCCWLEEHNYFKEGNDCAFVTCGDWDLKAMLPSQCKLDQITLPLYFRKWINLKRSFFDTTDHYPRSILAMLSFLELDLEGQLHSGIDDVNNMIRIICSLQEKYNTEFKINTAPDIVREFLKGRNKLF